jgi:uncharacterized membrane protein YeiH
MGGVVVSVSVWGMKVTIVVIASGAKQSSFVMAQRAKTGLRRRMAPRNDEEVTPDLPTPSLPQALVLLDYFGIAVFAISGALLAAEKRQTLVTFIFFAVVTGVGGGTLRDLLIGAPVFWVHRNAVLLICMGAALLVWLVRGRAISERTLLWFDALGLGAYATYGAAKAAAWGVAPVPAFAMGVLTACAGGIIRDVLAGQPSILMRPELYVTAAALSAGLFVGLTLIGLPAPLSALVAALAGFALRGLAIARGWSLPAFPG